MRQARARWATSQARTIAATAKAAMSTENRCAARPTGSQARDHPAAGQGDQPRACRTGADDDQSRHPGAQERASDVPAEMNDEIFTLSRSPARMAGWTRSSATTPAGGGGWQASPQYPLTDARTD